MLQPDTVLDGRYRIIRILGQGGMGGVYLATYVDRAVYVAVKELQIQFRDQSEQDAVVRQFRVEAELLYGLQHASLPRMYDYFEQAGSWYLVMDYIEGSPLDRYVEDTGPLSEHFTRRLTTEIVDVLAYLHGQESPIIFRDLKPANLMLGINYHITMVDFGIAKMALPNSGKTSTLIRTAGTTGFAAPEQYGAGTDERSDIYSLGATLYYLLTGLTPAASPALAVQAEELTPLEQLRPDVSPEFRQLIEHMMKLPPGERPASMNYIATVLASLPTVAEDGPMKPAPVASDNPAEEAVEDEESLLIESNAFMIVGPRAERVPLEEVAAFEERETIATASVKEAAEILYGRRPQAVVLCLTMSVAWNEVTALAARCRTNRIPFFVVAASPMGQSRLLATRLGCRLFFHLPVPPKFILTRINEVLRLDKQPTPRVMAVDDDDIALAAMEAVFIIHELDYLGITEPALFWKSLDEFRPDFLILDFEMPGATGLDLCRMVRSDPKWRTLPILILTAATDRGLVNAVYEAGADDYATKPMRSEDLLTRVVNRIRRLRMLRESARAEVIEAAPVPVR